MTKQAKKTKQAPSSATAHRPGEPLTFHFASELFVWSGGQASWFFIRMPVEQSTELREQMEGLTNGFGSIRVEATIEESIWKTSVFPETATGCYLLPVKKQVRKGAEIDEGDMADVSLTVLLNEAFLNAKVPADHRRAETLARPPSAQQRRRGSTADTT